MFGAVKEFLKKETKETQQASKKISHNMRIMKKITGTTRKKQRGEGHQSHEDETATTLRNWAPNSLEHLPPVMVKVQ